MNQQADPQADSAPTCAEDRQVLNSCGMEERSVATSQPPCITVCIMLMTTRVSSARSVASGPSSVCVAARMASAQSAKAKPAPRP